MTFARQTRAAVSLFLDGDVPDLFREQAVEFDDWCRELPHFRAMVGISAEPADPGQGRRDRSRRFMRKAAAAVKAALRELDNLVPAARHQIAGVGGQGHSPMNKLQRCCN